MLSRDERLQVAKDLMRTGLVGPSEADISKVRKLAGTASRLYRPGWRFWNWLVDAEYTSISGIPPIFWILLGAATVSAGIFIVLGILFMVSP